MRDSDWEIIYELYRLPNMTKVADKLYLTQPSLTKRLKGIEDEFHVRVVDRTPKGVRFTPEGMLLAAKAETYMKFMQDTKKEMQLYRKDMAGTILLGSAYSYQKEFLNDILTDYAMKHRHTNFEIKNEPSNTLFRKVCYKDLDAAFIQGDYEGPVKKKLMAVYRAYVLSREPMELMELKDMPMIEYRSNDRTKELLFGWWLNRFKTMPPAVMSVTYIDFAWNLVEKGLGFTLCFLPDHFKHPGICCTPIKKPDGSYLERNAWFVYNENKQQAEVLQDFISYIAKDEFTDKS